jgi:hypothetical protein
MTQGLTGKTAPDRQRPTTNTSRQTHKKKTSRRRRRRPSHARNKEKNGRVSLTSLTRVDRRMGGGGGGDTPSTPGRTVRRTTFAQPPTSKPRPTHHHRRPSPRLCLCLPACLPLTDKGRTSVVARAARCGGNPGASHVVRRGAGGVVFVWTERDSGRRLAGWTERT